MEMSYLYIMTIYFWLVEGNKIVKKHVYNSVEPLPENEPIYNITNWVRQLHLQQCVIVEVGEQYCAVFVEHSKGSQLNSSTAEEYFLGLCDSETLRKWRYCSAELENERPNECIFRQDTQYSKYPSRVHRRLCDISSLAFEAKLCDCSREFAGQNLLQVTGFPTCFIPPLPESICLPRNVCGMFSCNAITINQKVHSVKCSSDCLFGQPFCEQIHHPSSKASQIESYWTDWKEPTGFKNYLQDVVTSEAICINKNTGLGAIDCLGPGTNCCPPDLVDCKCHTYLEDGVLKLFRRFRTPIILNKRQVANNYIRQQRDIEFRKFDIFSKGMAKRDGKDVEYEEDDDDSDDEGEEDIVLEDETNEPYETTTESLEKCEFKAVPHEYEAPVENSSVSPNKPQSVTLQSKSVALRSSICISLLILIKVLII